MTSSNENSLPPGFRALPTPVMGKLRTMTTISRLTLERAGVPMSANTVEVIAEKGDQVLLNTPKRPIANRAIFVNL